MRWWEVLRFLVRRAPTAPLDHGYSLLALYNAERARGIVHTPEWQARMARLQADYNKEYLT